MKRLLLWLPFALFALIGVLVAISLLRPSDGLVRSRLVGRELPAFNVPPALPGRPALSRADFTAGTPRVINIFASWCIPCIAEAPQLMQLARQGIPIDAVAIRDRPEDVARFLAQHGDPFQKIGQDRDASLQLAIGSSGVPETYVVDGRGIIRYQHIGAINAADTQRIAREYEQAKR